MRIHFSVVFQLLCFDWKIYLQTFCAGGKLWVCKLWGIKFPMIEYWFPKGKVQSRLQCILYWVGIWMWLQKIVRIQSFRFVVFKLTWLGKNSKFSEVFVSIFNTEISSHSEFRTSQIFLSKQRLISSFLKFQQRLNFHRNCF